MSKQAVWEIQKIRTLALLKQKFTDEELTYEEESAEEIIENAGEKEEE